MKKKKEIWSHIKTNKKQKRIDTQKMKNAKQMMLIDDWVSLNDSARVEELVYVIKWIMLGKYAARRPFDSHNWLWTHVGDSLSMAYSLSVSVGIIWDELGIFGFFLTWSSCFKENAENLVTGKMKSRRIFNMHMKTMKREW